MLFRKNQRKYQQTILKIRLLGHRDHLSAMKIQPGKQAAWKITYEYYTLP